jgi:hypothetical protein
METWNHDASLLPRGPAAHPGPGQLSRMSGHSEHPGSDAARASWQPAVTARVVRRGHAGTPAHDPDDAKTAPEPAIKVRPGPSPGPLAMSKAPVAPRAPASPPSGPAREVVGPARPGPARDAASHPPGGESGPPPPAAGQPQQPGMDPDDAKTAPQPAIRIRPVPEIPAAQPWPGPGPAGYDEDGFVPGLSRPKERQRQASRPQQVQPSWPTILATTVRLWLKRRASGDRVARKTAAAKRGIMAAAVALVVVVAAVVGFLLSGRGTSPPRRPAAANPVLGAQAARGQAAAWISQQAGRNTIVSCDPVMCSALLAHGFPAGNLDRLGPDAPDPLASDLIAATSVLRSQFGARLSSVYAPVTLATFGTGSAQVAVRVVAADGAAAYAGELRADLASRKAVGAVLLQNSKIVVDPQARRQLASGMVDARLLVTLATMADDVHPVQIAAFGGAAPGAGAGVPLRTAVVFGAATGSTGHAAVLSSLRAFLLGQQPPYLPASTQIVRVAAGQSALRIQYAAPSPLGLLGASHLVKIPSR